MSQQRSALSPLDRGVASGLKPPSKIGQSKYLSPSSRLQSGGRQFKATAVLDQQVASRQQLMRNASPQSRPAPASGGLYRSGSEAAESMVETPCQRCRDPQQPRLVLGTRGPATQRAQEHAQIQPKIIRNDVKLQRPQYASPNAHHLRTGKS